jgi:Tfp pilus assembly protein PilO
VFSLAVDKAFSIKLIGNSFPLYISFVVVVVVVVVVIGLSYLFYYVCF